jgi:hypothetical protein
MTLPLVSVWMPRINSKPYALFVSYQLGVKNDDLLTEHIINDLDPSKDVINVELNLTSGYSLEELQLN